MGKKEKQQTKEGSKKSQEELLSALEDFTLKENWDQFFSLRGSDDSFEWYAEWPQLQPLLTKILLSSEGSPLPAVEASELSILVPGCGNSKLSEHLYDAGFTNITNVDFSKVVISDMLRRNVRERPKMKWRVMDMTSMQFGNESFSAIVDKGGLDALMEPKHGPRLGNLYLSEVKRLLKSGGRYICLTLAEPHVLDLLFPKCRFGWKMSLYNVAQESSTSNPKLQTFMVVAEKHISAAVSKISSSMDERTLESPGYQVCGLYEALERENAVRLEYLRGDSDIQYSIDDLNLGAKGDVTVLEPGRRVKLILGDPGLSRFFYKGVLLDARKDHGPFTYYFAVFLVPKLRAYEWLFSSEEGQWLIVASSKAARLVMILLDSSNSNVPMDDIQMDLSPLVKQLAPAACDDEVPIPYMTASDGIRQRNIVHEVVSPLTGPIIVDDVMYENISEVLTDIPPEKLKFRRLIFGRAESLVQSEAVLSIEGLNGTSEVDKMNTQTSATSKKKGKQKKVDLCTSGSLGKAPSCENKVDHNCLASPYHNGIISGLMLLLHLKGSISDQGMVKTVIIGLGAGLLPMFMKMNLPTVDIKVIELDPVVFDIAREYFGFREGDRLKVHITDGIKFVEDKANSGSDGKGSCIDILIIDVDSSDSTSGLTCPAADFVEEAFLMSVKSTLSERGLFLVNLLSRSPIVKAGVYSRLKKVFSNLFSLQLEEDVNEVIFALKTDSPIEEDQLSEARNLLVKSLELESPVWSQKIIDTSKLIKPLLG